MQKKVIVLASGEGSNFDAIVKSDIVVNKVICNNPKANIIKRAKTASVPVAIVDPADQHGHGIGWIERRILEEIPEDTDLIVLAGYMRILSKEFINNFQNNILNIHPSLLPKFKGLNTHKRAIESRETKSGCTVHYVNEELDGGKIIEQKEVAILRNDTPKSLGEKILKIEHKLYPEVIKKVLTI